MSFNKRTFVITLPLGMIFCAFSQASANPGVAFQGASEAERAVVKITSQENGVGKVGTGFIVQLGNDSVYIATASHVVEGDASPKVEFYTHRNMPVIATIVGLEGGDPKGLALLVVKGAANIPAGLAVLSLSSVDLNKGDQVTIIGFPRMAGPWSLLKANVVSRSGREIIFSGGADEGNSGGPMLSDGQVVGLVTGSSGSYGRAAPTASLQLFLEGSGIKLPEKNQPAASTSQKQDRHWLEADDYFVSTDPYEEGWISVSAAKMKKAPTAQTKKEALFFVLGGAKDLWTKYFWKTRPAEAKDLQIGALAFCTDSNRNDDGVPQAPADRSGALGDWWLGRITDISNLYKGIVNISDNPCGPTAIRVPVQ